MELLFEYVEGTIHFDPSIPCTIYHTKGYMSSKDYRTFTLGHLEVFEKQKIKYPNLCAILSDTRQQDIIDIEDLEWLQNEWMPKAKAIGVRLIVVMVSDNVFGQYGVEDFVENTQENGMQVPMFNDLNKARKWLKEESAKIAMAN